MVPVIFVRDLTEAQYYKNLLQDHDIPVVIDEEAVMDDMEETTGIAVLVAEENLAEAQDILELSTDDDEFEEDLDDYEDEVEGATEEVFDEYEQENEIDDF